MDEKDKLFSMTAMHFPMFSWNHYRVVKKGTKLYFHLAVVSF